MPHGDRDFALMLTSDDDGIFIDNTTLWSLSYCKTDIELLPEPYSTRCLDYLLDAGFQSEFDCRISCTDGRVREVYGKSFFRAPHREPENVTVLSRFALHGNRSLEVAVNQIEDDCHQRCHWPMCHETVYDPNIQSQSISKDNVIFRLMTPNGPQITAIYHARFTLVSFVIDVLATLSIWTGMSFSTTFDVIAKAIVKKNV